MTRPANLAAICGYEKGLTSVMEKELGYKHESIVFFVQNGSMTEYRFQDEMIGLKEHLLNLFKTNPAKIIFLLDTFKKNYQELSRLLTETKELAKRNTPSAEIIYLVKSFDLLYQHIWPATVVMFWIPLWLENVALADREKNLMGQIINARHSGDKEYVYALEFYDVIGDVIRKTTDIDTSLLTPGEMISILESGSVSKGLRYNVEKRSRGIGVMNGNLILSSNLGNLNNILLEQGFSLPEEIQEQAKVVGGEIASRGFARGVAKLLFSRSDMAKVEEGDIIISPMTTPYFASVLGKASAIVTDEGGITCHAAIVSRELGKPCIIGTKIATKVFKDGDMIEVDADKGVVKLIKSFS